MAEALLSWRGLALGLGGRRRLAVPDLDLHPGEAALLTHRDPKVLKALARLSAARETTDGSAGANDACERMEGRVSWSGKAMGPFAGPGDRIALFRRVALVDSHARLLSGETLMGAICLDLEYNQGRGPEEAGREAMRDLQGFGLARLGKVNEAELAGPERGLALMALALSRRTPLIVLDRPRALLDDEGMALLWAAAAAALSDGRALLALDYSGEGYPRGLFKLELGLSSEAPPPGREFE